MYVCNCNAINEKQVISAIKSGASGWDQVHQYYGYMPCCGKCETEITQKIQQVNTDVIEPSRGDQINCSSQQG